VSNEFFSGARLTGAGWGGCAVMLVPADQSQTFLAGLKEKFYQTNDDLANIAFVTGPSDGAQAWNLHQ
jgi:galactokinase